MEQLSSQVVDCLQQAIIETYWTHSTIQMLPSLVSTLRKQQSGLCEPLLDTLVLTDDTHFMWLVLHGMECHCQPLALGVHE
jgi:hypothetical protein